MDKSVWVEIQEAVARVIDNTFPMQGDITIQSTADTIAHRVCDILMLPETIRDADYEKWVETKKTLTNLFEKKEVQMNLKQMGELLGKEREALIAELEDAESRSTIIPLVESLHENKKLIKANQEAIDAANKD